MADITKAQHGHIDSDNVSDITTPENHKGTALNLILYNGHRIYTVSAAFYNDVLNTVSEVIHIFLPSDIFTLRKIYGEALWLEMIPGDRKKAGKCMAHIVANKRLPQLRFVEHEHEYPKKYQLR
jgi:hypothetical protein